MYDVYLGTMLCPITPQAIKLKIKNENKTVTLINEGEVNILRKAGLTELSFDLLLPSVSYPFARGQAKPKTYLDQLEELKVSKKPFQFIVSRMLPSGKSLHSSNIKVTLEDYSVSDDASDGFDTRVSINLKQYRAYGTKTCNVSFASTKPQVKAPAPARPAETSPKPAATKTYTVKKGDCLWNIAKQFYGNGSQYNKIFQANSGQIKNPNLIYPGQVLTIPA